MKNPIGIVLPILFLLCGCSETVDPEYSTLAAARKENAIRTGMVPEWLPETSRHIKVAFDISTNEKILTFQYKPTEEWNPLEMCQKIDPFDPPKPNITRTWWPENVPANSTSIPPLTFFACDNGGSFLAANLKGGQAFYWNTKI